MGDIESILIVDWNIPFRLYIPKFITKPADVKTVVREAKIKEIPDVTKYS